MVPLEKASRFEHSGHGEVQLGLVVVIGHDCSRLYPWDP